MNQEKIRVNLQILDNSYPVMCEPHERSLLIEAAELLNNHLQSARKKNARLPLERLLLMSGLHMTFQMLQDRQTFEQEVLTTNRISEKLLAKFATVLDNQPTQVS